MDIVKNLIKLLYWINDFLYQLFSILEAIISNRYFLIGMVIIGVLAIIIQNYFWHFKKGKGKNE